jgi:hypothetical protein
MQAYDFEVTNRKDNILPADFSSYAIVNVISWDPKQLQTDQEVDLLISHLKKISTKQELPYDSQLQCSIWLYSFIKDSLLWRQLKIPMEPSSVVLFLPHSLVPATQEDIQGSILLGHDGLLKTNKGALQCYYWPSMGADISAHLKSCH